MDKEKLIKIGIVVGIIAMTALLFFFLTREKEDVAKEDVVVEDVVKEDGETTEIEPVDDEEVTEGEVKESVQEGVIE